MINTKNKRIALILFCLVLPMFLLLLSYKVVLAFTNLTSQQEQVFSFLEGKEALPAGFTELEISHLEDVKGVMKHTGNVFYALLLLITVVITYYRKDKNYLLQLLNNGGKVTVAVIILLGAFSLFFFDAMFALFHKIFFPQGNWQFPADSLLIQTFLPNFFIGISRNIFILTLVLGVLIVVIGRVMRK